VYRATWICWLQTTRHGRTQTDPDIRQSYKCQRLATNVSEGVADSQTWPSHDRQQTPNTHHRQRAARAKSWSNFCQGLCHGSADSIKCNATTKTTNDPCCLFACSSTCPSRLQLCSRAMRSQASLCSLRTLLCISSPRNFRPHSWQDLIASRIGNSIRAEWALKEFVKKRCMNSP
jgi:hypothetical protein